MKFLMDACVSVLAADFLRGSGHDVRLVHEIDPKLSDTEILALANAEARILVTRDKDFGELIFNEDMPHRGIIRLPSVRRDEHLSLLRQILETHAEDLAAGALVTAGRRRIRIRRSGA